MQSRGVAHLAGESCVTDGRSLRVLIAEDDLMIADSIEEILVEAGYEVCGIARTVAEAVTLGRRHLPDLAIIDCRLADEGLGTDVAAQLVDLKDLGILYATGNISSVTLKAARGQACLAKPYSAAELVRALEIVAEIVATGLVSRPVPPGLQILVPATPPERAHG